MTKARFRVAIGIAAATVGVVVLVIAFFPWNALRAPVARYLSRELARPVAIGNLSVKPGWTLGIRVEDLSIGNTEWSKDPQMAHVRSASAHLKLLSLLSGTPMIPVLELSEPDRTHF